MFVKERGSRPLKYAGKMTQVKLAQLFEQHQVGVLRRNGPVPSVALVLRILRGVNGEGFESGSDCDR